PEKYVFQPVPATRIGPIAGLPRRLPSYACHRAPHRPFGLPLCDYHGLPLDLLKRERLRTTLQTRCHDPRNRRLRCLSPPGAWKQRRDEGPQCLRTDINARCGHMELRSEAKRAHQTLGIGGYGRESAPVPYPTDWKSALVV